MEWEQFPSILFLSLPLLGSVLVWGQRGNVVILLCVVGGGFDCISPGPPSLFNILARVAHSLAMWPQPWHLKHCKVLESLMLWAPPCAPFCARTFPHHWDSVLSLVVAQELWMEAVWPRPVWPLWSWGRQECFCPLALSHNPCAWDYLEH